MIARLPVAGGLYVLADSAWAGDVPERLAAALEGGAAMVQYRHKQGPPERERVRALCALAHAHHVPFIVNDDVALALAVNADGVHLGRDDLPIAEVRARWPQGLIGASCYDSLARATQALADGADYLAFGRFYPSQTKPEASPAPIALLAAARERWAVPLVAIGGITPDNGAALRAAGADFLAVAAGVFGEADPRSAAARYAHLFQELSHV